MTRGVFPSDIVLRNAVQRGIEQLRARPHLIDAIFQPLLDDDETQGVYGAAEAAQAREWFLNNEVAVRIMDAPEPPQGTSVTIQLADGEEGELTLADVHYEPSDVDDTAWPVLAGPVDPATYDPATGLLTLPDSVTLVLAPGMVVVDREGGEHAVQSVPATRVAQLAPGTRADLRGLTIRGLRPARRVTLGSLSEQETYQVGVHAFGSAQYLSYLWPIIKYVMLRARRDLESRGMERVRYSYFAPERDQVTGVEQLWSRYVSVTAHVRQTWVQDELDRIYTVDATVTAAGSSGWGLDQDADVLSGVGR